MFRLVSEEARFRGEARADEGVLKKRAKQHQAFEGTAFTEAERQYLSSHPELLNPDPGILVLSGSTCNLINTGADIAYLDAQPGVLLLQGSDAQILFLRLASAKSETSLRFGAKSETTIGMGMRTTEGISMKKEL